MFAARNLPLDSSLKFSILLAVPSCCTFTMLHYGSLSAVAQNAVMIEPESEPSPEQSVTSAEQSAPIPAASIPPAATSPAALACCITARRMRMHRKRPCKICTWRNKVLPVPDSPVSECHTPLNEMHESDRSDINIALMEAKHTQPNQIWMEILRTEKLKAGCPIDDLDPLGRRWFRLPTRDMRPLARHPSDHHQTTTSFIKDWSDKEIVPSVKPGDEYGTFVVYHQTKLQHLVEGHEKAAGSKGVLKDMGMSNGTWHGDGIGVYAYASPPYELFTPGDGYCILELKTHMALTRVKGGSKGRYPPLFLTGYPMGSQIGYIQIQIHL